MNFEQWAKARWKLSDLQSGCFHLKRGYISRGFRGCLNCGLPEKIIWDIDVALEGWAACLTYAEKGRDV